MASEKRGFIVNYYTTFNGTKLTKHELGERILKLLEGGSMTCGNIARTLKVTNQAIYNVTAYMIQDKIITKYKDDHGIYVYRKTKECLLADLLLPKAEDIEKAFKVKNRIHRKVEDGTSKGYGSQKISYGGSYYSRVHWGE